MSTRDYIEKDYYKSLGVPKDATAVEIKKAYRKLARVHQGLMLRRVERVTRLPEAGQPELGDGRIEGFSDLPKSTLELAVFACPADVIENGKQRRQRVTDGELPHRFTVTFDPLAVVGVLGLHPLEICSSLSQLGAQLRQLNRVDPGAAAPGWAPRRRPIRCASCGRRIVRDCAGRRIEMHPALVADDWFEGRFVLVGAAHEVPSSTISASITSSAPSPAPSVGLLSPPSWLSCPAAALVACAFA